MRTRHYREAPTSFKRTRTKPPCPHGGYKVTFEAYFVDLRCVEKHNVSTAQLEYIRKHHGIVWFSVNSHIIIIYVHYLYELTHIYTRKEKSLKEM